MKTKLPILALASLTLAGCGSISENALAAANNGTGEGGELAETRPEITVDEARLVAWDIVARQDTLTVLSAYKDYKVALTETEYDEEGTATTYSYLDISSDANGYFAYDYGEEGKDYIASVDGTSYYITEEDGANVGYASEKLVKRATRELSDYIGEPIDIALDVLKAFRADSLPESDPVTEEGTELARIALNADASTSEPSSSEPSSSEETSSEMPEESSSETPSSSEPSSSSTPATPEISESLLAYSEGEGDLLLAYAYSEALEDKSFSISASVDIRDDLPVGVELDIEGIYSASYAITYGTSEEERTIPEFTISEETIEDEHDHHEHPWCPEGDEHGHGEGGSELDNPPSDDHGWGKDDHGHEEGTTPEGDDSSSEEPASGDTREETPGEEHNGHPGGWH